MMNKDRITRSSLSPLGSHKQVAGDQPYLPTSSSLPRPPNNAASNHPRVEIQPDQNGVRYALTLKVDKDTLDKVNRLCGQTDAEMQSPAKRALMIKFREHVLNAPIEKRTSVAIKSAVSLRLDLRLPERLVSQIAMVEATAPFEPRVTTLARYLAPRFASFVTSI